MKDAQTKHILEIKHGEEEEGKQNVVKCRVTYHKSWGRSNFRGYLLHIDPVTKERYNGVMFEKVILGKSRNVAVMEAKRFSQKTLDMFTESSTTMFDGKTIGQVIDETKFQDEDFPKRY